MANFCVWSVSNTGWNFKLNQDRLIELDDFWFDSFIWIPVCIKYFLFYKISISLSSHLLRCDRFIVRILLLLAQLISKTVLIFRKLARRRYNFITRIIHKCELVIRYFLGGEKKFEAKYAFILRDTYICLPTN